MEIVIKLIDKELNKNPYIFIKHMLYIDQELEKFDSRKKYQVIPIRTNFTPKFIPINVHSFVDMLDSKYLLKQIKNYYHDQTDRGIILFETYFNFSGNFITNSIKKGYVFSIFISSAKLTDTMMKLIMDVQKLKIHMKSKIKKTNNESRGEIKLKDMPYNDKMKVLNYMLNDSFVEKKQIEDEMFRLFKTDGGEFMKVDNMSKKYFEILDKLNCTVIDPGMNSIFTMMSKDGKIKYNYTKGLHINRTSRKRYQMRIEKYKKGEITKIEDVMSESTTTRWKTSTKYENFIKYYNNKMRNYNKLTNLYDNEKLNKLKWNQFINEKRSENLLVNDIKKKFGSDVVLILGDWSMCKGHIKGHAPTPNKKYTNILERNFITLRINEFRTSIIHNKHEIMCKNYVKTYDPQKENIKCVKTMEILRNKNEEKYKSKISKGSRIHKILVCKTNEKENEYVNRDENSTKNMIKIVESYIKNNHKPIQFVMGTKVRIKRDSL